MPACSASTESVTRLPRRNRNRNMFHLIRRWSRALRNGRVRRCHGASVARMDGLARVMAEHFTAVAEGEHRGAIHYLELQPVSLSETQSG
jgi:hypothetical protein